VGDLHRCRSSVRGRAQWRRCLEAGGTNHRIGPGRRCCQTAESEQDQREGKPCHRGFQG
jgi:hypothetical protein